MGQFIVVYSIYKPYPVATMATAQTIIDNLLKEGCNTSEIASRVTRNNISLKFMIDDLDPKTYTLISIDKQIEMAEIQVAKALELLRIDREEIEKQVALKLLEKSTIKVGKDENHL